MDKNASFVYIFVFFYSVSQSICVSYIFLNMPEHNIISLCKVLFLKEAKEQKTLFKEN